jgi:hypothetical protein
LYGLWEAVWLLRTTSPELGDEELPCLAREALSELLAEGLVKLVYFNDLTNEPTPIPDEQAQSLMADQASWQPPAEFGQVHIRYIVV